jgi:hypothetical protein
MNAPLSTDDDATYGVRVCCPGQAEALWVPAWTDNALGVAVAVAISAPRGAGRIEVTAAADGRVLVVGAPCRCMRGWTFREGVGGGVLGGCLCATRRRTRGVDEDMAVDEARALREQLAEGRDLVDARSARRCA